MMKRLLLLFAIIVTSCAKESTDDIPAPLTPEEIAAEAAKKESDSLIDIYGNNFEVTGVAEVEFLFEENDNTYLAGKLNNDIWIGVFNENLVNKGETTLEVAQTEDFVIRAQKHKSLEEEFFFSVFSVEEEYKDEMNFPFTRFVIKQDLETTILKYFSQDFEAKYGNQIFDVKQGKNNSYLINTSGGFYPLGSSDIIYLDSSFENPEVWQKSSECYPDFDYPNFNFVNEKEYFYHTESYFNYVHMDVCEKWEISIEDIFNFGGCIGCNNSIEVLEYTDTEIRLKANLNNDFREVTVDSSTGEIISNTEV